MSDIELRHLATMTAVVDEGSFSRAAARLGYTQSTVSQQIATLEKTVGGAVFDRPGGPRPVRLTPLGQVVLTHARDLLARTNALVDALDRFRAGEGRIDIGTFQSLSTTLLPRLVLALRAEFPACDIRLFEDESGQPRVDDVDLMFLDSRADGRIDGDVEHRKLLDDPYMLVARRGDFPDGAVPLAGLHRAPMVAWPADCDQPRIEAAFARAGVQPRIVFRTTGNDAVLSMVRAGIGSAVLPRLALGGVDDSLAVHELDPAFPPREIYLLWRAGRTHSPLAARAIDLATDIAGDLLSGPASGVR
ncbi:LysR family transcriptional regulator [Dactylosporangium sp. NPDC000521]|uniref:LysR family transcriptional regulator n=1 Tax=Dactylosporangium sp. NPDC000521 TaxID=3363975 RepID=UPI0036AF43C1